MGSQCTKPLLRCIALWHVVTRLSLLVTVLVKEWHCGLTVLAQPSLLVLATNTRSQLCAPLIACCAQLPPYARLRRIAPLPFRIRSSTATHVAIRWLKTVLVSLSCGYSCLATAPINWSYRCGSTLQANLKRVLATLSSTVSAAAAYW